MTVASSSYDPRFLPVTQAELYELEIEISVLTPLQKIDSIDRIEVGKHGLYIRRAEFAGLLLPQVATEWGWDRMQFLQQTCMKAGLAPEAWKEGAEIFIFSAEIFSAKV
jgi:hypothetical protein